MPIKFPDYTKAEWLTKVEKDLKGKPLDSLNWEVAGKEFSPFWHREDARGAPPLFATAHTWKIGVVISNQDLETANQLALEALEGGANALWFSRRRPLAPAEKDRLLDGIFLEIIECTIDTEESRRGTGNLALDLLRASKYPELPPVFYLRQQGGYFETIAYFRAVRYCWRLIADTCGMTTPCQIKAFLRLTAEDPNQNMISSTVNAAAAVMGGADTIFLPPADGSGATSFYRRIARNVLNLLQEESHLNRVADPAAGSYFIEALTDHYAGTIWSEFQQLSGQQAG